MNSEVTLTNYSTYEISKGQVRLLYKRSDPRNAILLEDGIPRYLLATSDDGVSKVTISDPAQQMVAEVNRRMVLDDIFKFADRNHGKTVKVANILQKAPSTSNGQRSMALNTEDGVYYWRKRGDHHWTLYEDSNTPVAWTESVSGSSPTWALVVDGRAACVLDYILVSLFYMKSEPENEGTWNKGVDGRTAWLSTK